MSRRDDQAAETALFRLGYRLVRHKKHKIYKHSLGPVLTASVSSSDCRALANTIARARRLLRHLKQESQS